MIEKLLELFSNLPKEVVIVILAVLPISELRGAIPVGISVYQLGLWKTIVLAMVGNFSFVIPFLWFLNNLHQTCMRFSWYNRFSTWWFNKVKPKTKNIEKYEYLGLTLFVGIPLPMTGAWSGCVASYLLGLEFWKSIIAIFVGIIIACIIVTFTTVSVTEVINFVIK